MSGLNFQFINFTPREGVPEKAFVILDEILSLMNEDMTFSASIERWGNAFYFEIIVRSSWEIYHTETTINIDSHNNLHRLWQCDVLDLMKWKIEAQLAQSQTMKYKVA